jgi:DNA-binding response OmpR family regulator
MADVLNGRRILVVEDDCMVALEMSDLVEKFGGAVAGPAGQFAQGFAIAESEEVDGAVLDVNLGAENSYSLADKLLADDVPIIFATAYDASMIPERFADAPMLRKPFSLLSAERAFRKVFAEG